MIEGIPSVNIENLIKPEIPTVVLDIYSFLKSKRYAESKLNSLLSSLFSFIWEGKICGLISNIQAKKLRRLLTRTRLRKLYSNLKRDQFSLFICVYIDLDRFKGERWYVELFDLYGKGCIHAGDLSNIILAIETRSPLVTEDSHIFRYQRKVGKCLRRRHGKGELEIYDLKYFVDKVTTNK